MNTRLIPMKIRAAHAQAGIVLPIVLVFLVIMTLLGVTAIRNVTLEEKMAGNSRYQQLAFQAGEAALRSCESDILSTSTGKFFDVQTPQPLVGGTPGWGLASANWSPTASTFNKSVTLPSTDDGASIYDGIVTARCMVERLQPTPSKQPDGLPYCPFRVTARVDDVGGSGTAVLLQSYIIAPLNSGRSCPIDK